MRQDELSLNEIKERLSTRFIGQNIIYRASVGSTMDVAREQAKEGATAGTVVIADEQTKGRGRLKREWLSRPGDNLTFSLILHPDISKLPCLIMVSSLAIVDCIRETTGREAVIKWPNDVLMNGKKVAGILIENELKGNEVGYAIIGIGLNVNYRTSLIPEISAIATSLAEETGGELSRHPVLLSLFQALERYYQADSDSVFAMWRDKLITLGRQVQVKTPAITHLGIAETVNADGSLMLRTDDGHLVKIVAEDVTLRT